ncbi:peptidoglycan-associated lipoprotein Pal [Ottowia sp.]|mgnify:CR=1 FL=1|uniref:peptidoglycan-associated lipoprotein Pal n=1 Tax=Ottowia sp. TaxID=1898956 RepID=UPI001D698628|nr:peptidoglycan-associated lipoprotein Pal [Ottowia sp.]MCB2025500.1 peptidoglycan-associated lipoprotein Pal [Ottowia sp.]MCP5257219.1 peptidoglycan-associated lipoprotein Pal [Burkholderiaceae bacterium]HPK32042.1 peptidoglycan-associated lipoprotein Pal [Ottowia sp.]HRW72845.1 peptidoglycan-associated lipoprotein Pal [Ottowia sp.]
MLKKLLIAAGVAALLAGCGSNVKLDPPIQGDGAATSTTGAGTGANAQGAGQSSVTQVQAGSGGRDMAGPAGVGKVVYFDYDSFVVKPDYQPVVEAHARFLQADRNRHVVLEGNTDERGSREYNLALGQKRAEAVRRSLSILGVSDAQVEAVSFGEEKPAVAGSSEEAYAKNRRVEFSYR